MRKVKSKLPVTNSLGESYKCKRRSSSVRELNVYHLVVVYVVVRLVDTFAIRAILEYRRNVLDIRDTVNDW